MSRVHREGPHYVISSNSIFTNKFLSTIHFNNSQPIYFIYFQRKSFTPMYNDTQSYNFFITRSLDFGTAVDKTRDSEACCEQYFQNHYISRVGSSSFK